MVKHHRVFISSTHAQFYPKGTNRTDITHYEFQEGIACKGSESLFIELESFAIPIARTNVFSGNNVLSFGGGYGDFTITVPVGQYTTPALFVTALQAVITSASASITVTYNALTNKITLRNTRALSITLKGSSVLGQVIGLSQEDITLPSNTDIVMPSMVDLSGARNILVVLQNCELNSMDTSNGNPLAMNVLASIPVSVGWGQIQTYQHAVDRPILSNRKNISSLIIQIIDENGFEYDISGLEWSALINVTVTEDDKYRHH